MSPVAINAPTRVVLFKTSPTILGCHLASRRYTFLSKLPTSSEARLPLRNPLRRSSDFNSKVNTNSKLAPLRRSPNGTQDRRRIITTRQSQSITSSLAERISTSSSSAPSLSDRICLTELDHRLSDKLNRIPSQTGIPLELRISSSTASSLSRTSLHDRIDQTSLSQRLSDSTESHLMNPGSSEADNVSSNGPRRTKEGNKDEHKASNDNDSRLRSENHSPLGIPRDNVGKPLQERIQQ